jgi:hypothetical protein
MLRNSNKQRVQCGATLVRNRTRSGRLGDHRSVSVHLIEELAVLLNQNVDLMEVVARDGMLHSERDKLNVLHPGFPRRKLTLLSI